MDREKILELAIELARDNLPSLIFEKKGEVTDKDIQMIKTMTNEQIHAFLLASDSFRKQISGKVNKILELTEQKVKIPVKHPGALDVPEGKNVEDLPLTHFKELIKKKGWERISKALINLKVWNKKRDPKLSSWADNTQEKLAKWVESQRLESYNV